MSAIEKELLEATEFKPAKKYADRQDYLGALMRAVDALDQDTFDGLSNDTAKWVDKAIDAINDKDDIPDFPAADEDQAEGETEEAAEETAEEPAEEEPAEAPPKRTAKAKPAAKAKPKPAPEPEPEPEEEAPEEEAAAPPRRKGQPPVPKKKERRAIPAVTLDDFGLIGESKNSKAAALFVKGTRMSDVTEALGGTYYNMLRRLVENGHKLEKEANGLIRLVHKDKPKAKGRK